MEEKKRCIGPEINRLHHIISRYIAMYVKESGIDEVTMMHGWIMRYLYEHQHHDVFQKDIEKKFSIGRSSVTGIIQIMEKKGYIRRESVEHDARLKKVLLTEKGIEAHESMESMATKMEQMIERNIDEQELEVFFRVIDKIRENMKLIKSEYKKGGIVCYEESCTK